MAFSKGEVNRAGKRLAERVAAEGMGVLGRDDERADLEVVQWWRDGHVEPMLDVYDTVEMLAPPITIGDASGTVVTSRLKRIPTAVEKLTREPGRLTDMADLGGVRAVVAGREEADALGVTIRGHLETKRVRNWSLRPRSTGYRALHLHVTASNRTVEVQVRTFGEDMWANVVEEEGRLSGLNYKAGQGHPEVLEFFRVMADLISMFDGESHPDAMERFAAVYSTAKPLLHVPALVTMES